MVEACTEVGGLDSLSSEADPFKSINLGALKLRLVAPRVRGEKIQHSRANRGLIVFAVKIIKMKSR